MYPITDMLVLLDDIVTATIEIKTHNSLKRMHFISTGDDLRQVGRGTLDDLQSLPGLAMKFNYPAADKPKPVITSQTKILLQVRGHVLLKDCILTSTVGRFGNKCIAPKRIFRF